MKETNKKIIIILMMIILVLSVFYMLALTGKITLKLDEKCITQTQPTDKKLYTYDEIKGLYTYKGEIKNDEQGNEYREDYKLYLYPNGTYIYNNYTLGPHGHIGNYIIADNKIKLNYLYGTGGGTGMFPETGTEEITINNSNELSLANNSNTILSKQTSPEYTKEYEEKSVNDIIKTENGIKELEKNK